jgi:phospholipid/cholesterol/gamma-HCH transport system permease protein
LPTKNLLEQVGDMMILTGKTVSSAIRPPYPYGTEFVQQFLFALRLCWFPLLISTIAFGYGAPGLQAGNFLVLFGAIDRLGGFFVLASIREFAPFVTAIILAGVAGTAITADLGARKIREELDALQVLGVDPVKNLVVPRFLSLMIITGLFNIYALLFGIFGGVLATLTFNAAHQRVDHRPLGLGGEDHPVRGDHRHRLLLQGDDCVRRRRGRGPRRQPGRRHRLPGDLRVQLRLHADAAGHPSRDFGDQVMPVGWLSVPRDWIASFGVIAKFSARVIGEVLGLRVFRFFGEALRQCGVLILGSTMVIWGLAFILGLQCGIEGAYFNRSVGAPAYAGVFSAWCDLREIMPYAFGYMMSAKVGTGLVAEIGSMRITDEIDALEVMGISSMTFLCATRLLAAWLVLPFMYVAAVGAGFFASYLAVVQQIGEVSSGGFFLIFWMFQNPPDLLYSVIKGMAMATVIVLVGLYYGYTASGGPVGVGTATAKSMVLNTVLVHLVGMLGTQVFWGSNPRAPIGG